MRVRTVQFEKLRSGEKWTAEMVEGVNRHNTVELDTAITPPPTGVSCNPRGLFRTRTQVPVKPDRPPSHDASVRAAKPVATWPKGEYQRPAETAFLQGQGFVGTLPSGTLCVVRQLNECRRKTPGFQTPAERFNACVASTS